VAGRVDVVVLDIAILTEDKHAMGQLRIKNARRQTEL
jgi:hypothetical protein